MLKHLNHLDIYKAIEEYKENKNFKTFQSDIKKYKKDCMNIVNSSSDYYYFKEACYDNRTLIKSLLRSIYHERHSNSNDQWNITTLSYSSKKNFQHDHSKYPLLCNSLYSFKKPLESISTQFISSPYIPIRMSDFIKKILTKNRRIANNHLNSSHSIPFYKYFIHFYFVCFIICKTRTRVNEQDLITVHYSLLHTLALAKQYLQMTFGP